eukprot:6178064-Pleurochrysis_carterae.AAC.1
MHAYTHARACPRTTNSQTSIVSTVLSSKLAAASGTLSHDPQLSLHYGLLDEFAASRLVRASQPPNDVESMCVMRADDRLHACGNRRQPTSRKVRTIRAAGEYGTSNAFKVKAEQMGEKEYTKNVTK